MNQEETNIANSPCIKHVEVNLRGYSYKSSMDDDLAKSLNTQGIEYVIRGQWQPAAGPGMLVDYIISHQDAITTGLLVSAIAALAKTTWQAIKDKVSNSSNGRAYIGKIVIQNLHDDFVIFANLPYDDDFPDEQLTALIDGMKQLCQTENTAGRIVLRIETPTSVFVRGKRIEMNNGWGGLYSLWKVVYRESALWPDALFDAENMVFIPLDDLATADGFQELIEKQYQFKSGTER